MRALAATGDAPLPEPWRDEVRNQKRIYIATKQGGGQVATDNRLDAMNASKHVEEHPGTSIEHALVSVVKERNDLAGLEVFGTSVKSTRPTPSTRRCPRNCGCSMAWRSTYVYRLAG